jgi:hypothetical protein
MSIFWELFFTIGGWFTWALAAVAVGTAVYSGVSANQAKKKAQGQAGAADKAAQEALDNRELFVAPPTPLYMPWNFKSNQARAIEEDANAYARSDKDYKKRHGGMVGAEAALESEISKDWKGEHELMPQMQAELAKAGIFKSLDALGGTGGASVLAPGSAGEANVARHLGLGTMAFQDRNRNLRHESLKLGEEVFPRRQFGMTGADYVSSSIADVSNKNAWEAANYERGDRQCPAGQRERDSTGTGPRRRRARQSGRLRSLHGAAGRNAGLRLLCGQESRHHQREQCRCAALGQHARQ